MSQSWQVLLREFISQIWKTAMPIVAGGIGIRLATYTLQVIDERSSLKELPERSSHMHDLSYIWNSKN
jgi:hypothetical protein